MQNETAVIIARASDKKQVVKGDTLETQQAQGTAYAKKLGNYETKVFKFVESARKEERAFFDGIINFCLDKRNNVRLVLFKDFSRFTREGSQTYLHLKQVLTQKNIEMKDFSTDIIQGSKNTMDNYGFEYSWSKYYPSEGSEIAEAERVKAEVRSSLTRMIGEEINYSNKGFWMRNPPYGLTMEKAETEYGRRSVLKPEISEARWITMIRDMKLEGVNTDQEIVNILNNKGYKSRNIVIRDKTTKRVIGERDGIKLSVKKLTTLMQKTIYAGVVCEKWTKYKAIPSYGFKGLFTIDDFNHINKGRIQIIRESGNLKVIRSFKKVFRVKDNPQFPYKKCVLCPLCKKPFSASKSKGKREYFSYYHCARNHKRYAIPIQEFHRALEKFVEKLKFSDTMSLLFKNSFLKAWESLREASLEDSRDIDSRIEELKFHISGMLRSLASTQSDYVKKAMEEEIEQLVIQQRNLTEQRNEAERTYFDVNTALSYAVQLMEHPLEILLNTEDIDEKQMLLKVIFTETPTYEDLINGTPKISPIFKLAEVKSLTEVSMVPSA